MLSVLTPFHRTIIAPDQPQLAFCQRWRVTVMLYLQQGKFNFGAVLVALNCLLILLLTRRKQISGKQ